MKARRVAMGCALLALAGVGFVVWRLPGSELALLGPVPIPVMAISVESTTRKPRIDVTWPLIGHFVFPKPVTPPVPVPPETAGILVRESAKPPPPPGSGTASTPIGDPLDYLLEGPLWRVGQEAIREPRGRSQVVECPRVFGKDMVEASVVTSAFGDDQTFKVRLPFNGLPEPPLPSIDKAVGDWQLTLRARPWLSPSFPFRYEVRCKDDLASVFEIEISWVEDYGDPRSLLASNDRPGDFNISGETPEDTNVHEFTLRIRRLSKKRVTLRTVRGSVGAEAWIQLVGNDGKALVWADRNLGAGQAASYGYDSDHLVQVDDHWATPVSGWRANDYFSNAPQFGEFKFLDSLKDGETVDAFVYSVTEERKTTVKLDLPNPAQFIQAP